MAGEGALAGQGKAQTASTRFGIYNEHLPVVGKTVKEVRNQLVSRWSVPTDAQAYSGKTQLADDYVIKAGDAIEFQRRTGEKGS